MIRPSRWLRRVLVLAAILLITTTAGLWLLPRLLIKTEINPLPAGDAIIQVAFDPEDCRQVAELYSRRLSRKVVCASSQFSPGEYVADYARLYLIELGVAAVDIEVLHLPLTDCFGEVLSQLGGFVQRRGWKTVLLVVHPEDSRAVSVLAPSSFGQSGIRAIVSYSRESRDKLIEGWWRTHSKAQRIVGSAFESLLDLFYAQCR